AGSEVPVMRSRESTKAPFRPLPSRSPIGSGGRLLARSGQWHARGLLDKRAIAGHCLQVDQVVVEHLTGHIEQLEHALVHGPVEDTGAFLAADYNVLGPQERELLRHRRGLDAQSGL